MSRELFEHYKEKKRFISASGFSDFDEIMLECPTYIHRKGIKCPHCDGSGKKSNL